MTNNINGIDVSECDYFEKQHIEGMYESDDCNVCIDNYCALCWKECEKHNGCYFKQLKRLQKENEWLKANKGRCAFKSLDNTFCDEAKIRIDKLELDKDCLNASLETARKYRGVAETDRDKYKRALEKIKKWATNHNPCDIDPEVKCTKEDCFNCLNYDIKKITRIKRCVKCIMMSFARNIELKKTKS